MNQKFVIRLAAVLFAFIAGLLAADPSFAAVAQPLNASAGAAAIGQSAGVIGAQWGTGLQYVALAVGIGLAIFGLLNIIQAKRTQQPMGPGVVMVVIAILLTSLVGFLQTGSESIFGTEKTATFFEKIGN